MKYLNDLGVQDLLWNEWPQIIKEIEEAFLDSSVEMIPKTYLKAHPRGDFRAMPVALGDYACLKWIGVYPSNHLISEHLPTTLGTILLNNRETGEPLIAMDCTALTAYRTAATSAIVAKYAAKNAKEITLIGCGDQAYYHFLAYKEVLPNMKTVCLYDKNKEAVDKLSAKINNGKINIIKYPLTIKEAVKNADIITTLTPSEEPYLNVHDVKSNCHINAVGADAKGKRELMTNVIDGAADIFCDDYVQASHSGELQYNEWPYLNVIGISDLIKNHKTMQLEKGISVFDSTGVALEDIAIAILIYRLYYQIYI